jgi:hypothetical protein
MKGYIGYERIFKDIFCEFGYEFRTYPKKYPNAWGNQQCWEGLELSQQCVAYPLSL